MLRDISLISKKKKKYPNLFHVWVWWWKWEPRSSLAQKPRCPRSAAGAAADAAASYRAARRRCVWSQGCWVGQRQAQRVGVALSKAQRGSRGVVCVQTALQTPGRHLEWESLLYPRQGEFRGAPGLLCTCWIPMSTMEEMVLSGEAGCCNPQERECGCCWACLGVLKSLFSPRRVSRGPQVRWGGLSETGCSGNLDQKDCF